MPSLLSVAATWDPSLAALFGTTVAEEFVGKGANMILGPQLCVHRVPYEGRNFERLSGEDPYLGSQLAGPYIRGVQAAGVMTVTKHFALKPTAHGAPPTSADAFADGESSTVVTLGDSKLWE